MSDYPMLISNKLHSFRNFDIQRYEKCSLYANEHTIFFIFGKIKYKTSGQFYEVFFFSFLYYFYYL